MTEETSEERQPIWKDRRTPNRKSAARLAKRIAGYEETAKSSKAPDGAFTRPGSQQAR